MSGNFDKENRFSGWYLSAPTVRVSARHPGRQAPNEVGKGPYSIIELRPIRRSSAAEDEISITSALPTPDPSGSEGPLLAERETDGFPWHARSAPRGSSDSLHDPRYGDAGGHWPVGVTAALFLVAIILVANAVVTLWASVKFSTVGGIGTLHVGPCDEVIRTGTIVHILINCIGSLLLGASNFCMQCLTSPTRKEIDGQHAQKRWLEIGVLSLRNLRVIGTGRVWLWFLLGMSSFPIHLLYNSAVFVNLTANEYLIAAVTPEFVQGGNWSYPDGHQNDIALLLGLQKNISSLQRLDPPACINTYGVDFLSGRRHVLAVTQQPMTNNSLLGVLGWSYNTIQNPWVCGVNISSDMTLLPQDINLYDCTIAIALESQPIPIEADVLDHCLSQIVDDECRLQFSLPIMLIVIFCNCVKLVCILTMLMRSHSSLVTLGDAVASFLENPDPTTRRMCTTTMHDIRSGCWPDSPEPKRWVYRRSWRWQAAGLRRWIGTNAFTLISLGLFGVLLYESVNITTTNPDLATWWSLGFGAVRASSLVRWSTPLLGESGLLKNVLLANLPQLLVSSLYLAYNALFTCMSFADEWSEYFSHASPLRVTRPRGFQRPTSFLTLPYHYIIPLLGVLTAAHFLLSQGMFLAAVDVFDFEGNVDPSQTILTIGFSVIALIILTMVLGVIAIVAFALGWRRLRPGMPLAGPCTAAISAACHVASFEDGPDTAARRVQWGVVETKDGVGHLAFSAAPVGEPVSGRLYM